MYRETHVLLDELAEAGMRKLPHTASEDLLEIIMRRYERFSAMLDRLVHHGHVLKCGSRSWRTKTAPTS